MKIFLNKDYKYYLLVPTATFEKRALNQIIKKLECGDKIEYIGKNTNVAGTEIAELIFQAGGSKLLKLKNQDHPSNRDYHYINSVKLILRADTKQDKYHLRNIREICFAFGQDLFYVCPWWINGKQGIIITVGFCRVCERAINTLAECAYMMCDSCAAQCNHKYIRAFQIIDFKIVEIVYCVYCGRKMPEHEIEPRELDTAVQIFLELQNEAKMSIILEKSKLTPERLAQLAKIYNDN